MENVSPNDLNVDASAIVHAPVNPDHAPAEPVGLGNGFAPYWIGDNIPNNQNGWIEEDAEEEEENPEEDPEEDLEEEPEDDDVDMEIDDEVEVIDPYIYDGSNNPPPPNSEDEETPPTSPVIPDADGQPIPPIASFGQNFHFDESSSTANLLTGDSKIVSTGPMCPNLGTIWKRLGKMEKFMSERIDTEGRIKKKFKEQDCYFLGLGCDNIEMDRTESVKAAIRAERERVQNEANRAEGPNVAPVVRECTFADFLKCSPITFRGNERAVGLIRWIEKTEMVFTVSKCTEANKVVFVAATFQDRALTWWNSQVATSGIEVMTRKMVKEMDISSYATCFNELVILYPGMVPTERKKVEAYIHGLSENIKGEVTSSEPATLRKAVRMAHNLMEQKVKAKAEREVDNKKRKGEEGTGSVFGAVAGEVEAFNRLKLSCFENPIFV
nr:hypothetical protein [Tanacetum cinerariifolium]